MKTTTFPLLTLFIIALSALSSCKKETVQTLPSTGISEDFNYATSREIEVDFQVKDIRNNPDRGVKFEIYSPKGDRRLFTGASDASGRMHTLIRVPSYMKEIMVRVTNRVGVANNILFDVSGKVITGDFGGSSRRMGKNKAGAVQLISPAGGNWYFMGTYNSLGVPDYLEVPGDDIDPQFINDISSALPEFLSIPVNKPQFLAPTNAYDVHMIATGEVWITFLGEGAGALNTMGYYTYETANPPATANDIDSIFVLFPNASTPVHGGLQPGDKVKLGTFDGGTSIGWVMLANGWNVGTEDIKASNPAQIRFYSTYAFNPEPNASQKIHNVQLLDGGREIVIVGFEDVRRDYGSDHDFNDFLMTVTVTPFSALDITNIPVPEYCEADTDNDGVSNCDDDYPADPLRAFNNPYSGTLGYEDLWPGKGDYDFNDLVIQYNTNQVTNASNEVKDVNTQYTILACGGALNHGFGVQFDNMASGDVSAVSGSLITQNISTAAANGTEAQQTNAVVIAYDNITDHVDYIPGEAYMNTLAGNTYIDPVDMQLDVTFTSAADPFDVGLPPYNPFIFTSGERGKEIHLPNKRPTDLVEESYFGISDDDSDPVSNRYYKTSNNYPWAIHIEGDSYEYPVEYTPIYDAYLKFNDWAVSNGTSFNDWYLQLPGYRSPSLIY